MNFSNSTTDKTERLKDKKTLVIIRHSVYNQCILFYRKEVDYGLYFGEKRL